MNIDPDRLERSAFDTAGARNELDYQRARASGGAAYETADLHRLLLPSATS